MRFNIVGFNTFIDYYIKDKNISNYEHWLYGKCNNKTDTEGISHLIEYKFFENSACIKKYFNSNNKQYYDIGDPNFKWPVISHGTFNPQIQFYSIIIERCREDTLNLILGEGQHCKNDKEMEDLFINIGSSHLYYIDNSGFTQCFDEAVTECGLKESPSKDYIYRKFGTNECSNLCFGYLSPSEDICYENNRYTVSSHS